MRVAIRNRARWSARCLARWGISFALTLALATGAFAQGDGASPALAIPASSVSVPASLTAPLVPSAEVLAAASAPAPTWPEPTVENTYNAKICPAVDAKAADRPDDAGGAVRLTWKPCPKANAPSPKTWVVLRAEKTDGPLAFAPVGQFSAMGEHLKTEPKRDGELEATYQFDDEGLVDGRSYVYRVLGRDGDENAYAFVAAGDTPLVNIGPVSSERQTFLWAERDALRGSFTLGAPDGVSAADRPNDAGEEIRVEWTPPTGAESIPGLTYRVFSATKPEGPYTLLGAVGGSKTLFDYKAEGLDEKTQKEPLYFAVAAVAANGVDLAISEHTGEAVAAEAQWVNLDEWNFVLFAVVLSGFILYFIQHIKSGKKLFVRKIAGLEAVEESIGRATEMGKPVLYIPGIMDMNDVMTVAAIVILGRIARQVAEYDTKLLVPTSKSLVMTTGRETVKEAFISAGRPDAYNDNIVTYLTDEQFGYVAGVNGIMVREKPATCIYFGAFFAESLILAETGNSIGAIQIAGTAQAAQLPFFIAACDYTLIGEELFAASAYLSHDPKQLGSLKGQDIGKLAGMVAIVVGGVFATIAQFTGGGWAGAIAGAIVKLFTPIGG